MLKDDRMMGMLTFVVIMIAAGTVIQRADVLERLFGPGAPALVLSDDEAVVRATRSVTIDVLGNDTGLGEEAGRKLTIVSLPRCGQAQVRDGRISYLSTEACIGEQRLEYGLAGNDRVAAVRITVQPVDAGETQAPRAQDPLAPEPAPAVAAGAASDRQAAGEDLPSPADVLADAPLGRAAERESAALARVQPEPAADAGADDTRPTPEDTSAATPDAPPAAEPGATQSPAETMPSGSSGEAQATAAPNPGGAAASGEAACTTPAAVTLDLVPGAMTRVMVDSPCHPGGIAELAYDGLRFAIQLDARGVGRLDVPGFQSASDASLSLDGRGTKSFIIPFRDVERVDRVAVVWEAPAGLALSALEFGARPGQDGHVGPDRPGSFEAARRAGGGWLTSYAPAGGRGRHIEVYSFWRRYGGPAGVVRLGLDLAGSAIRGPAECSGAPVGGADYKVLRMERGRPGEPRLGRVAAFGCTVLAGGERRLIDAAVDDLIVRR